LTAAPIAVNLGLPMSLPGASHMRLRRPHCHVLSALVCAVSLAGIAHAQGRPSKGEQALTYRKAVYQTMVWNFGPLAAMAQDKIPYDAAEFRKRAERVALLTPMLAESYIPDTRGLGDSKLKPEMWSNRADFDQKLEDLVDRSATLAEVAKAGDAAKSKAAFFETANACKACHDKYRAD
jgi:cytochrome c556